MSQVKIKRQFRIVTVNVGTATASCTTLRTEDMAGAVVQIGTISTNAATFQIWGNTDEAGTFARLYDAGGSAADITLAPSASVSTVYALPDAAFALPYTKIVAATTNSECVASVVVKS
jgi:hypothetical protein